MQSQPGQMIMMAVGGNTKVMAALVDWNTRSARCNECTNRGEPFLGDQF